MRILVLLALSAAAQAAEWTGAISEAGCGLKHAAGGAEQCVEACVKKGAAPVFVTNNRVIRIANAERVMEFLGKKVKIEGRLERDAITVDRVETVN
ncbi:MAG: hypothetical protein R2729_13355 [Bryobacteraceae bacterium]